MTPNPITASRERIQEQFEKLEALDRYNLRFNGYLEKFLLQHEAVVREEMARKLKKMLHPKPRCYCREFSMGDHECVYTSNNAVNDCISAVRTTQPTI